MPHVFRHFNLPAHDASGSLHSVDAHWRDMLDDYVASLSGADQAALQVYTRCALNPGGLLDHIAKNAEKALETSSAGAIWFTRCVFNVPRP